LLPGRLDSSLQFTPSLDRNTLVVVGARVEVGVAGPDAANAP
jgi:hypothetical protein